MLAAKSIDEQVHIIETEACRVEILPELGGKFRNFLSKRTGIQYFFQDPRTQFDPCSYSSHDISGLDECFPTVADCVHPDGRLKGIALGDHGFLWNRAWECERLHEGVRLRCAVPEVDCQFVKECHFIDPHTLRMEYEIENRGSDSLSFVYSAHPLLWGDKKTKVLLPAELDKVYVYLSKNLAGVWTGTYANWPLPSPDLRQPFRCDQQSVLKAFSHRLNTGRAAIYHAHDEILEIGFDTQTLPYLGILILQGLDATQTDFGRSIVLGLEPTTGMGDDIPTCERTETTCQLAAGETLKFWITLGLKTIRQQDLPRGPVGIYH